jgi:O-antigen/teichoic acid export membrane protein
MVTTSLHGQLDKFIIAPLLGFVLLGNYALALQIIGIMMIFPSVLFKFILPQDSSGISNKKLKKLSILISIFIFLVGFFLSPIIIPELFPKYTDVVEAIQIMSINVVIATFTYLYTSKFLGLEKSKYLLINKLIGILILATAMIILGSLYGIFGLAIAFLINSSSSLIFLYIIDKFKMEKI